jgi:hypothetical protein
MKKFIVVDRDSQSVFVQPLYVAGTAHKKTHVLKWVDMDKLIQDCKLMYPTTGQGMALGAKFYADPHALASYTWVIPHIGKEGATG